MKERFLLPSKECFDSVYSALLNSPNLSDTEHTVVHSLIYNTVEFNHRKATVTNQKDFDP